MVTWCNIVRWRNSPNTYIIRHGHGWHEGVLHSPKTCAQLCFCAREIVLVVAQRVCGRVGVDATAQMCPCVCVCVGGGGGVHALMLLAEFA